MKQRFPRAPAYFWPILSAVLALALWPGEASAYVGPPMALGAIGAVFGVTMTGLSAASYFAVSAARRGIRRLRSGLARRFSTKRDR